MASIESETNEEIVAQLSSEQKARLDEVVKQAELSLQSEEIFIESLAVAAEKEYIDKAAAGKLLGNYIFVAGDLRNYTNGSLTSATDIQHQYAGSVLIDYPNSLDPGSGNFSMGGNGSVEAAVVYFGTNSNRDQDCAWLIGFRVPQMEVYVVCGPMTNFNSLDWGEIKIKIERGGQFGSYYDKNTGTQIYASLASDPKNGRYSVTAVFY
uniref:Uncharacterized protein n=1 Tax=Oryza punctata TaxID=4537 RepID=A0A0E0MHD6_ORYPU